MTFSSRPGTADNTNSAARQPTPSAQSGSSRRDMMGHFAQHRPEFVGLELHSHEEWNLLMMIIRPIAASMPWMAAAGKMALRRATFNLARITWNTPAMAMATRTSGSHGKQLGCRAASPEAGVSQGDHAGE